MSDFFIKQGDTSPNIKAQLTDENGTPVDLSGAVNVYFHMENYNTEEVVIEKEAVIETAEDGIVYYDWVEADTETPGRYNAEWQVDFGSNVIESYPNHNWIEIEIVREIA